MRSRILGSDSLVLLAAGPDAFGGAEPCLENLAERRFVIISRRGRARDFVDDALAAAGLTRRVALTVPTLEAAAAVMRGGGLLTVVPRTSARALTETHGLHAWTPPFATEPLQAVLSWHARFDSDPAHAWLRQQVADVAGQFLRAR
jgi:DNA-binding transcriptional LysR family regulator